MGDREREENPGRVVLDCGDVASAERFDMWTDAVNRSFVPLRAWSADPATRAGFAGKLVAQELGPLSVSSVSGSPVRVSRTRSEIARDDPGHIKLGVQLQGRSVISQDGRDAILLPGDFAVYDTTRPYSVDFDDSFRMLVVMFPLETLRIDRARLRALTASRFSGHEGVSAIASSLLRAFDSALEDGTLRNRMPLSDAVLDMLTAALGERLELVLDSGGDADRRALLTRIEMYIAAHLGDAELTVAQIAAAHHVSVRYLQKLFEGRNDTVSSWIRHRRLDATRRDLSNPSQVGQQIASIGARWGFTDATAFSRAFRTRFGVTPSEYRAEALQH
ncbi:helix-turn-helix domain-containing protein [Microbacterium sp. NPDC057944]|uniref:AraC-like ligand-binding domain-containing protein n=1 Tax=Microbacterium sp. NPDC057944 TaxID=3346286 RepID=UPI0036DBD1B5